MKLGNLNGLFDIKMEEIETNKGISEKEKLEMLKEYAKAYKELIEKTINKINNLDENEKVKCTNDLIGNYYINDEGYINSSVKMTREGIKISLQFDNYSGKSFERPDDYLDTDMNKMFKNDNIHVRTNYGNTESSPKITIVYKRLEESNSIIDKTFDKKVKYLDECDKKINEIYAEAYINLISNVATNDINKTDTYERISIKEPLFGNYYTKEDKYSSNAIMTNDGINITLKYDDYSKDRCYRRDEAYNEDIINELLKDDGVCVHTRSGREGLDNTTTCIEFTRVINKGEKKLVK